MARLVRALIVLAVIGAPLFYWRDTVRTFALQMYHEIAPCEVPITYSIQHVDPRFGISTSTLSKAVAKAASLWDEAAGKPLFQSATAGLIAIRLEYDQRQATTETLQELGANVENNQDSYESVKAEYAVALSVYESRSQAFDARYDAYQTSLQAYQRDVRMWNSRGGAPRSEYEQLQARERSINQEAAALQSLQDAVRSSAQNVNELVRTLNSLAKELNMSVAAYNTVGESAANEFEEAVYQSMPGSETITVYEYGSIEKLTRVLAHEFGHALDIEHVEDEDAIMYRINKGSLLSLTVADIEALNTACKTPLFSR